MVMILTTLGGLGIFLLGMMMLSENLQAAASNSLRSILRRMTYNAGSGVATGVVVTSLLQSSSATLLITLGLVNAGIISFGNSLGIIYGANLGTTSTAWIVALLGFKVNMSTLALPLVGFGALIRLFARGYLANIGLAAAGFGLIFLGIDFLQDGMGQIAAAVNLQEYDLRGLRGYFVLTAIGIFLSVVLQSSSAAMVTTITALYAGAINFPQAAVMVIGQSIGTTATAGFGAIGASVAAKRTAMAHFLFNVLAAVVGFALLPLTLALASLVSDRFFGGAAAISLAVYQVIFKSVGVAIALPLNQYLARFICSLIRDKPSALTQRLDRSNLTTSEADVDALRLTVKDIGQNLLSLTGKMLASGVQRNPQGVGLRELRAAIEDCYAYFQLIHSNPDLKGEFQNHVELLHSLNHLDQISRMAADHISSIAQYHLWQREWRAPNESNLELIESHLNHISSSLDDIEHQKMPHLDELTKNFDEFKEQHQKNRKHFIQEATLGRHEQEDFVVLLEANRTIESLAFHCRRFLEYYIKAVPELRSDHPNTPDPDLSS